MSAREAPGQQQHVFRGLAEEISTGFQPDAIVFDANPPQPYFGEMTYEWEGRSFANFRANFRRGWWPARMWWECACCSFPHNELEQERCQACGRERIQAIIHVSWAERSEEVLDEVSRGDEV